MFNYRPSRRTQYIGGGILLALLFIYIVFRCLPPSQEEVDKCAVTLRQEAYYTLVADGKAVAYFADYADSAFVGGSVNKDSIHTRSIVQQGYWINRLPIVPSSHGRILIRWDYKPSTIVNLKANGVKALLCHTIDQMYAELDGLQTKRNEMGYYLRVHSVQDYGYNKIADYQTDVIHQMDSLRQMIKVLDSVSSSAVQLRILQENRYAIQPSSKKGNPTRCNRLSIDKEAGCVLLQTESKTTPIRVITRLQKGGAVDALKAYYKTHVATISSLAKGIRIAGGRYEGESQKGIPNGYGKLYGDNGSFYDGHWKDGKRDGFGIYVAPHEYLQVGEWKADVFKGERLTYTADRIYGIDVSRHQHEKNNKVYKIYWDRLRITDLGTLSTKTIKGKVDYPVSFAYVKSTEGCTVLNAYYEADYKAARAHNIRTGTYHFFSTKSAGTAQADYFLRCSKFNKGDLPPALDVEPTDAQIAAMGGPKVMFRHIRAWMRRVQQHTGKRPILYVSQTFANTYMPLAPDLGDNYHVWIARYGEYKPNFKLAYWQLSPDGKVRGIHNDVDINVFNGYRNQYEEFLKRHCF